jgi:DNA-directed RNA polymerase specialized sigma24 family protein
MAPEEHEADEVRREASQHLTKTAWSREFVECYTRHYFRLVDEAARILNGDKAAAEDCVANAIGVLWEHRRRYYDRGVTLPFFRKVVSNAALNERVRACHRSDGLDELDQHITIESVEARLATEDAFLRALFALPSGQRMVFVHKCVYDRSNELTAGLLRITPKSVQNLLT